MAYNNSMTYIELENYLFTICDKKFADFSKTLSNSDYISIGVKNPVLKQIAKDHIKDEKLKLSDFKLGKYLEVDYLYFALGLLRAKDYIKQLDFLDKNIYKAKSWAITDTASTYMKKFPFEVYFKFFLDHYDSKYTYVRRMSYILGLKFYKEKEILNILPFIKENEQYMVMMAASWLLATIAINYPNEIYDYLSKCKDTALKRKTISKISDSFRFTTKAKERFKSLRK